MAPTSRCPRLPDEIISDEIFARLPAKSALGCRALSSSWAATLSSDDFVDRYNALHAGRPKIFRLQNDSHGDVDQQAKSSSPPPIPIAVTGECFPRYVTLFWDEPETIRQPTTVTTHCRGLILVELVPTGIHFVCNPSSGQKRALPEGRTTGCRKPGELMHRYASLGLGYDARTRRHKVVRICYRGRDRMGRPASMGCEVYVVDNRDEDSSGTWRPVSSTPAGWVEPDEPSVFAQGQVYWFAHRAKRLHNDGHLICMGKTIVSFSISEETFGTVAPPPDVHVMDDNAIRIRCLTELSGRLCLFSGGSPPDHEDQYDVWLLNQSSTTWDLYCRIDASTTSPQVNRALTGLNYDFLPLAITDNGHRILLARQCCPKDIWVYTRSTGNIEKLVDLVSMVDRKNVLLEVAVYEESVASPGRWLPRDIVLTASPSTQALSLVLRLLPQRTIRRLMCVCRSWYAMIASNRSRRGAAA